MAQIQLSIAIGDYDQTRDVISGRVAVEGVELIPSLLPPEEVFHRFSTYHEWDISEAPMGRYVSMRSQGDNRITAIPVFVSRVFRHSMVYVRDGGKIVRPEQLRGARIGVPEWAQTASIYMRGLLTHDAEVPLESVHWVQAGVNMPGREEMVKLKLPENVTCQRIRDRSLNEMLLTGDLDAVLSARPRRDLATASGACMATSSRPRKPIIARQASFRSCMYWRYAPKCLSGTRGWR